MHKAPRQFIQEIASAHGLKVDLVSEIDGISVRLPVRRGLSEALWLEFDGHDELSLSVGEFFTLSAFPWPDQEAVEFFRSAADGILSGRYRICCRGFQTRLQAPADGTWKTVARNSGVHWHGMRQKVLVNMPECRRMS